MSSIYDMYLKNNIMEECDRYFKEYLKSEDATDEDLTAEDREMIVGQIDNLISLITNIYRQHDEEINALSAMVDKLIGICVIGKMNEARLCRLLNERKE